MGISHVVYKCKVGSKAVYAKLDGYRGEVKDPTDPLEYIDALQSKLQDQNSGIAVVCDCYEIKAARGYYGPDGGAQSMKYPHTNGLDHEFSHSQLR